MHRIKIKRKIVTENKNQNIRIVIEKLDRLLFSIF